MTNDLDPGLGCCRTRNDAEKFDDCRYRSSYDGCMHAASVKFLTQNRARPPPTKWNNVEGTIPISVYAASMAWA